ncbi:MAG: hypothetical protein M3354_09940 [Chloroflexota bacterium]|nr:hypothetical protein [Chloroflexota bacterium]
MTLVFAVAAVAGSIGLWQCRALFQMVDRPALPQTRSPFRPFGAAESRFLLGVFCFWFAAALNRPVLPICVAQDLQAPTAYFAMAAAATIAGAVMQPCRGRYGNDQGARAVLWLSGLGAGGAMLLWAIVPVYWLGIPVEAIAASCWLGHLLSLTLRAFALAEDEMQRATIVARTHLAQGSAAAVAPLVAVLLVRYTGAVPILAASGLLCLVSTGILIGDMQPAWKPAAIRSLPRRLQAPIQIGWGSRLNLGTASLSETGYLIPLDYGLATPSPTSWPRGLDPVSERRVRTRLPLALRRALHAGCPSWGGPGCRVCYGSGLG